MFTYNVAAAGAPCRAQIPGEKSHETVLGSSLVLALFRYRTGDTPVYVPRSITDWHLKPAFLGLDALRVVGAALDFLGLIVLIESFALLVWKGFGTPARSRRP